MFDAMESSSLDRWFGTERLSEAAERFTTPLYVYSAARLRDNVERFRSAFPSAETDLAFSVKACSNLSILRLLAGEGLLFDIVSAGELERLRRAGVTADRIVFAGAGKRADEIRAGLAAGIREFNVESVGEAGRLNAIAGELKTRAAVALRFNPDVDARTHTYISTGRGEDKFGVTTAEIKGLTSNWEAEFANLDLHGLHVHVGSQIREVAVWPEVVAVVEGLIDVLPSALADGLKSVNFGGGFAIDYETSEIAIDLPGVAEVLGEFAARRDVRVMIEPGRALAANAGVLLTRVQYLKERGGRQVAIVDAAMTELIRPALYGAKHRIVPVGGGASGETIPTDIVGPVCESGDFLARGVPFPKLNGGQLLAVLDAGAYGFTMSSNYNTRPRPAEVLIEEGGLRLIRRRESLDDLIGPEEL